MRWLGLAIVIPHAAGVPAGFPAASASIVPLSNPGGPGGFGVIAPVSSIGDGLACLFFIAYKLVERTTPNGSYQCYISGPGFESPN